MNILYLHQYFVFPDGSGGTRSYDLATSFAKLGYNVEIITSSGFIHNSNFTKRWNRIERDGICIHVLKLDYTNELTYFRRVIVFIKFLWFATFKLLAIKADFVLATSTPLTIGLPAIIKKWIHNTPFIFEVRDVWPENVIAIGAVKNKLLQKILFSLEKIIYKNALAIVPLSTDMKQSIISRYPSLTNKPIQVIENISEINRFQTYYNPSYSIIKEMVGFSPRFSVLYAGTFGKVNGINYVIQLAEKTLRIDKGLVYILIGSGAEKNKIIQNAKEKGVGGKNVFILNPVSKQELPKWYHESSMGSSFVIDVKELWTNSANKFFDTLAAGKPILINHGGWQKTAIEKDNIGFVLPSNLDNQSIIDFVEYTKNTNLQQQQQKNALKKAINSYSLSVAVDKYISIINDVV